MNKIASINSIVKKILQNSTFLVTFCEELKLIKHGLLQQLHFEDNFLLETKVI